MPLLNWTTKKISPPIAAHLTLDSLVYPHGAGYLDSFTFPEQLPENRLIQGDNLSVMSALLPEFEGKLSLIYADPPFFTNRAYPARVGRGEDSRKPHEWQLAEGYPDHWEDLDAYLDMLYPRLALMHRLLAPTGTLYLHLDWHANAYARLLLDEIFGPERLLNEIIWVYHGPSPIRRAFNRKHDTILVYTKSAGFTFNADAVRQPYDPNTVKTFAASPKAGFGKVPNLARGKVPEDWWYFPVVARLHSERTGYPTQKPSALLERILKASSNPGDWVADFFCGSGTLPVGASRLDRRWIASDATSRAVHTTSTRLVEGDGGPFSIYGVGQGENRNYEGTADQESRNEGANWHASQAFTHADGTVIYHPKQQLDLDYWEVDPFWDGKVFRSAAQAVRPRRGQPIPDRLVLIIEANERPIYVRWVSVEGKRGEGILERS